MPGRGHLTSPAWLPNDPVSPTLISTMHQILLATLLLGAAFMDLRSRRIPNGLVLSGVALAFTTHAIAMGTGHPPLAGPTWWAPLAGALIGLADVLGFALSGAASGLLALDEPVRLAGSWLRGIGIVVALIAGVVATRESADGHRTR